MEIVMTSLTASLPEVILGLIVAVAFLVILNIIFWFKLKSTKKRMNRLLSRGSVGLEESILKYYSGVEENQSKINDLQARVALLEGWQASPIQHVSLVRFNAFENVGSNLSFSAALLDDNGSGLIISSIYGREDSRIFAKPIEKEKSAYRLSQEEEKAIYQAMNNRI